MPATPVVLFDDANLAFRRTTDRKSPDGAWLYQVVDAVLDRLAPQEWGLVFDAGVLGWLRKTATPAITARLDTDKAAGRLTRCPADSPADPYFLQSARALGAVVVSNDLFRDHSALRVGLPTLRFTEILGHPVPALRAREVAGAWRIFRPDEGGRPTPAVVCAAVRSAAEALTGPVGLPDFVRQMQAALPAANAQANTGLSTARALLEAFPDVVSLEALSNGWVRVHPQPYIAAGQARQHAPGAVTTPIDELSQRRAQRRRD